MGVIRGVSDSDVIVWTSCIEFWDGSIDTDGEIELPALHLDGALTTLNSDQARELASALIEAAVEIDGWGGAMSDAVSPYEIASWPRTPAVRPTGRPAILYLSVSGDIVAAAVDWEEGWRVVLFGTDGRAGVITDGVPDMAEARERLEAIGRSVVEAEKVKA